MFYNFRLALLALPILLFLRMLVRSQGPRYKAALTALVVVLDLILLFNLGRGIYATFTKPPEWDFLTFWVDGQVATKGENFYDAANYQKIDLPYPPDEEFVKEILDVGFRYPPFTMFLFLPLGRLAYTQAYIFWQLMNVLLCLMCAGLLWDLFLRNEGASGFYFSLAMLLLLRATFSTLFYAQTNFIALMVFLLFWKFRDQKWSGVFLALGILVKPFLALVLLYPIFTRRWKQLFIPMISLAVLTLISGLLFGFDVINSYVSGNSLGNMPPYVYSEPVNQSLLSWVLRTPFISQSSGSLLFQPVYILGALMLAAVTFIVGIRNYRQENWLLLSILFFAFCVYPATLEHYGVFLIIPILLLLQAPGQTIRDQLLVFIVVILVYLLSGYNFGYYAFFANIFIWLICISFELQIKLLKLSYPAANFPG